MVRKISVIALFSAFAILASYIETFIPSIGIPGVKLGLANIAVVLALFILDAESAIIINVVRIVIVGLLFGNMFSIAFALAGAFVSVTVMIIMKRLFGFSIITVSIFGGFFHNVGQLVVAFILVDSYSVFGYLPVLLIAGIITGLIIGILAKILYERTSMLCKRILNN
ncbi:MAG TPA: heptaprenyl diphosphate synthase [Eubacterium sp.]|nr:heptaprenyl diphosphate synthase [Eubacterium sp.]